MTRTGNEDLALLATLLPEESNIAYLKTRFEYLEEFEISAILRATDVAWDLRVRMMRYKNGQRAMEATKFDLIAEGRAACPAGLLAVDSTLARPCENNSHQRNRNERQGYLPGNLQ